MPQQHKDMPTVRQDRMLADCQNSQYGVAQVIEQSNVIDSVESFYMALNDRDEIRAKALLMLMLRNWLTNILHFDPVFGHALQTDIINFMGAAANLLQDKAPDREIKDRIYRIVSHMNEAVLAIMEHPHDKILREHAMLPIHAAREVDSNSVQWLSRQPGRTLREKLSGKPYMKAVRRKSSFDTAENRLLKAFLLRLEKILIERQNALSLLPEETCEQLLVSLQLWLKSEQAAEIGAWGNLPPNNTLLQDKRYRKVWDGWLWLQAIDELITEDTKRINGDTLSIIYWNTLSLLNCSGRFRTVQQPINIDYDNFCISPEIPVRGFLFPSCASKIKGKIKFIKQDNSFGFITADGGKDLYFNPYNLSHKLDINTLSAGDDVFFSMGSNRQGECADNISLATEIVPVYFSLSSDKFEIQFGVDKYLLQIDSRNLVLQQDNGAKKEFQIVPEALKIIPKTILSLITNSSFEYSAHINIQNAPIQTNSSVVDLCSIRPSYTTDTDSPAHLPFRLLQQHWAANNKWAAIDCGLAKSIALQPDILTVSMRSLFSRDSTLPEATKNSALMFFIKKIKKYIIAKKLTYLVPDWSNDFDLEGIRKSVNFYFEESTPVPKSIASIFAWQSSNNFIHNKIRENDFVLVVDAFDTGISITPVQAIYHERLHKKLPETNGISWERHPTFNFPHSGIYSAMARNLNHSGCQTSEELIQLFGFDGLVSDAGEVSFVNNDHWYHLPESISDTLAQDIDPVLSEGVIDNCLNDANKDGLGIKVFILPIANTIRKPALRESWTWLEQWSPTMGCQTLNKWQKQVDDIPLWRDHLPELSVKIVTNGYYDDFYLVKQSTVTPQRGKTVNIPVRRLFELDAGQTHYNFPLQQGIGNKELKFSVYLRSPAFPLKKKTNCKVKMTYTYGADDPYDLKFVALDAEEAGFKSLQVEWRSASKGEAIVLENLPIPVFPPRKEWSDFQKFPKEDGVSVSDLLDWCGSKLAHLDQLSFDCEQEIQNILYGRKVGYWEWGNTDRNGDYYCRINVEGESVFCHVTNFSEVVDKNSLNKDCPVYLNVFSNGRGPYGKYISFSENVASGLRKELQDDCNQTFSNTMEFVRKQIFSLRFPALTIWNHGHSLMEPDAPDHFRRIIVERMAAILNILKSENISEEIKDELFFFLCCLHRDAPKIVSTRLLAAINDNELLRVYHKNIAVAIGNAELEWQQDLLKMAISQISKGGIIRSLIMSILSTALWRSKDLINKLTTDDFVALTKNLRSCLKIDLEKIVNHINGNLQIPTLCKHLELLLALLRSRENEDETFKMILAPDVELTHEYVNLVDKISKNVICDGIELKSRISLQIEKPYKFRNTPDLLYALRMYLTGDSGANVISISGITEE